MADAIDPNVISDMVNAPFGFQRRQQQIDARKARMTQLLKSQKYTPDTVEGSMVSGHYVAPSWSQQLNAGIQPAAQQWMTNQEQAGLEKDTAEFDAEDRKAAIAHAMEAPGVAASGEDREGNPIVPPATPASKIAWAEKGMHIPSRRDLLKKLLEDQTIAEPVRAEGRTEKRLDREDRQVEAQAALAQRADEAEKNRVQDEKQSKRRSEDQLFIAGQASADRRAMIAANLAKAEGKPPRPLPASQSKAWIENNTSLGKIEDALTALATPEGQNAFGLSSLTPDIVLQRTDPKGVDARAKVADIGSLKVHDRSGASVTAAETPRLKPFIPSVHDKPEVIKTKLENFQNEYRMIQQEIQNYAEDMNYVVPKVRPRAPAPAAPAAPAAPSRSHGGKVTYEPVLVNSKAERDKLQPGTRYRDHQGNIATR
jgi:hypothetical protein